MKRYLDKNHKFDKSTKCTLHIIQTWETSKLKVILTLINLIMHVYLSLSLSVFVGVVMHERLVNNNLLL